MDEEAPSETPTSDGMVTVVVTIAIAIAITFALRRNCWGGLKQQEAALGEFSHQIWDLTKELVSQESFRSGSSLSNANPSEWGRDACKCRVAGKWMYKSELYLLQNKYCIYEGAEWRMELGWFERKSRNLAWKRLSMQFAILEEIFPKVIVIVI